MTNPVKPIPEGYQTVTPYLTVSGVDKLFAFLEQAFDAQLVSKTNRPDGSIAHAEIKIGSSMIMAAEAQENWPAMPMSIYLYIPDVDTTYDRAVNAGAESLMKPANQFYGDRTAGIKDPLGNYWWLGTHIEDMSPEELQKRADAAMQK